MVGRSAKGLQLALVLLIRSTPNTSYHMLPLAILLPEREKVRHRGIGDESRARAQ